MPRVRRLRSAKLAPARHAGARAVLPGGAQVSARATYIRIDDDTLRRVERHVAELQHATEATVTQSDALRDLIRRGLDEADVERGRRARRRR